VVERYGEQKGMDALRNPKTQKPLRQRLRNNPTEPERLLWNRLKGAQLGVKFRRQMGIENYIVDFYCPERHLVIELDGDSHFTEEGKANDAERDAFLHANKIQVLRFTNAQVTENMDGVLATILSIVSARA
jgi:very-short-patch-repair endonuclease